MSDFTFLNPTQEAANVLTEADYQRVEELGITIDADVESWFSSSVACCDACLNQYIAAWPNAYRHDPSFQRNKMSFETFYEGSKRVRDTFAKNEFNTLLPYIACPRCLKGIGYTLYAYELPFSVPEDWQAKQKSLADRAANTPFLLLQESFAKEIFKNLNKVCNEIKSSALPVDLFRGRTCSTHPNEVTFFPPPAEKTQEGRYNHAGIPVLYLASSRLTCWRECRQPSSDFYVARIAVNKSIRILDLVQSEGLDPALQALIFSSLMSAPTSDSSGWYQPQYVLTRFVGDCVKASGVQGIMYPSVRYGEGNNLAVLDVNDCMSWLRVSEIGAYPSVR